MNSSLKGRNFKFARPDPDSVKTGNPVTRRTPPNSLNYVSVIFKKTPILDESESYTRDSNRRQALAACKRMVDEALRIHTAGCPPNSSTASTPLRRDPYIFPADDRSKSRLGRAKDRSLPSVTLAARVDIEWFKLPRDTAIYWTFPAARDPWRTRIEWARIVRICFKSGDFPESDEIYIFTDERPESRLIPIDASGGYELWQEVLRRKLFDAELAIRVATSPGGELFCDPDT